MKMQTSWIDRNQLFDIETDCAQPELVHVLAASRSGSITVRAPVVSFWVVIRGRSELVAREGRFPLRAGDWMVLEPESRPAVYSGRGSLVLGVVLPQLMREKLLRLSALDLHAGRGRLDPGQLRPYLKLWRQTGVFGMSGRGVRGMQVTALAPLLRHVCNTQPDVRNLIDGCPGRSFRRKSQVFGRMQRARLFLEGNVDRNVRLTELAQLSNVSTWYFTKVFHALYGEGPQAMAARLRLDHAAGLLASTTLSVSEVGAVSGFENNCSFSRAFRERFGLPPSNYRLNHRVLPTEYAKPRSASRKASLSFGT